MLAAAQHLRRIGHNVTFNTSENFRGKVESSGVRFVAMTGKANYDYRHVNELEGYKDLSDADQKILLLKTWFARDADVLQCDDLGSWRETPTSLSPQMDVRVYR
jgi:UDP:flavonoid glycosyltransferase YjiC (YdhE family)